MKREYLLLTEWKVNGKNERKAGDRKSRLNLANNTKMVINRYLLSSCHLNCLHPLSIFCLRYALPKYDVSVPLGVNEHNYYWILLYP